ncbi:MAG: S9 family peptidase [Acidobacteria bacterium]|nr:S9 family peptidase [Acidobacteriota bacterium]
MFSKFSRLACLLLLVSTFAQAQTKRPITHEDVWLMKRVGAPVPSPDGKWVVFSVVEPAYDEKDQVSDLWIVPADASAKPRRLTNTKGGESGATWSPDSTRIVFAARREGDEVAQLYILDVVNGGEAQRVTSRPTGPRSPQFSPDGKWLLFQSSVYPGALDDAANQKIAADRKARKYNARVYESFPIRNWDRWVDEKQTHVFVRSLEPGSKAKDLLAGTKLANEAGFSGAFTSGGDDLQAVWTPDSAGIVFVAMTNRNAAAYSETNTNLHQVAVTGGEPKALTMGKDSYSNPKFSPEGKTLFVGFEPSTQFTYNTSRLVGLAWPNLDSRKTLVDSMGSFAISQDGRTIYFSSEMGGFELVFEVPVTGRLSVGYKVLASAQRNGCYTNLATGGGKVFANWENATHPLEIVRLEGSVYAKPLTSFNAERVTQLDWQSLETFEFTSKQGRKIRSFIALPPNFDENKKYPLFVVIHGGPHSMWRDQFVLRWNYHLLAAPGYVVLLTNYTGSTGFGEKFAQAIMGDPLKTPGDEINEAADEAIKRFKFIDASRQAAGGASYGGHLANWLQATTTRYKCLISHAGLVNLETQWATSDTIYDRERNNGGPVWEQGEIWRKQNPIRYAAQFKTPILLSVGEQDFRVPMNNTLENWSVLQRMRVPSKLLVFPEENHWVLKGENSRFWYGEVHAWLKRWLN